MPLFLRENQASGQKLLGVPLSRRRNDLPMPPATFSVKLLQCQVVILFPNSIIVSTRLTTGVNIAGDGAEYKGCPPGTPKLAGSPGDCSQTRQTCSHTRATLRNKLVEPPAAFSRNSAREHHAVLQTQGRGAYNSKPSYACETDATTTEYIIQHIIRTRNLPICISQVLLNSCRNIFQIGDKIRNRRMQQRMHYL